MYKENQQIMELLSRKKFVNSEETLYVTTRLSIGHKGEL